MNSIEPLEARIAPAAVLTFTDVDGDKVTVKTSKGTTADLEAAAQRVTSGMGVQLQVLDLRDLAKFGGTTLTITATKPDGTPSEVNVGYVNATGNDLGKVQIDGDLGAIDAGNPAKAAAAVASLTVKSLGVLGTTTGAPDLQSNFDGALGKLFVAGDVQHAYLRVIDTSVTPAGKAVAKANIGSIFIGDDLIGGSSPDSGHIYADNKIGAVTIGGDLLGGTSDNTGRIASSRPFAATKGGIGAVKILGSMKGGSGSDSGSIDSRNGLASLFIGVNLEGGTTFGAGDIFFNDKPASKITIMGDFIGGQFPRSGGGFFDTGTITASGGVGAFFVGGSMLGSSLVNIGKAKFGSVTVIGNLEGRDSDLSGSIQNRGPTGSVKIGGDVKGGAGTESGTVYLGDASGRNAGTVTVGGSVIGGSGTAAGNLSFFRDVGAVSVGLDVVGADGGLSGTIISFGSMASLKIGRDLLGGTAGASGMINGPASTNFFIGKLEIGGSMVGNDGVRSGSVWTLGTIGTMTVGGSVSSGSGIASGGIRANEAIKSLTITGNVTGASLSSPVFITGGGVDFFTFEEEATTAIGKVVIKGNVTNTQILAGWDAKADQNTPSSHRPAPVNGDASIGSVEVLGTWSASDIAAGAVDSTFNGFGRNDALITPNLPGKLAKIGSVSLGTAVGSALFGEHFGIVAERLGTIKANGQSFTAGAGAGSGDLDQVNFNFKYQTLG